MMKDLVASSVLQAAATLLVIIFRQIPIFSRHPTCCLRMLFASGHPLECRLWIRGLCSPNVLDFRLLDIQSSSADLKLLVLQLTTACCLQEYMDLELMAVHSCTASPEEPQSGKINVLFKHNQPWSAKDSAPLLQGKAGTGEG